MISFFYRKCEELEFWLCTLTSEVQWLTFHRNHVIWRTKITTFWRNGNDSKQPHCPIAKWIIQLYHGENNQHFYDDNVHFVLDQHAKLEFDSVSVLKQYFTGRHHITLGHIILISPKYCLLSGKAANTSCTVHLCGFTLPGLDYGLNSNREIKLPCTFVISKNLFHYIIPYISTSHSSNIATSLYPGGL